MSGESKYLVHGPFPEGIECTAMVGATFAGCSTILQTTQPIRVGSAHPTHDDDLLEHTRKGPRREQIELQLHASANKPLPRTPAETPVKHSAGMTKAKAPRPLRRRLSAPTSTGSHRFDPRKRYAQPLRQRD